MRLNPFDAVPVFIALNPSSTGYIIAFVDDFILCVSVYPRLTAPPIPLILVEF